ncbi:uncharacterized protein BXZ73DRAFT_99747 [Epithele typhae]|uniref:uncharacterized protein n=1 Tax=Epithele typhae TaxID=378194 RepID=UPI002007EFE5|nr:uncharacterized protein BXZ73DRAFT_99747 [Epithele typhae]KAH9939070.1 hypothetical protein BXZ73DRAFT_99747 [Epithele typhae]
MAAAEPTPTPFPHFSDIVLASDRAQLAGLSHTEVQSWTKSRSEHYRRLALGLPGIRNFVDPIDHVLPTETKSRSKHYNRLALGLLSICNSVSLINRILPTEMLSEIFAHCWTKKHSRNIRVTRVCRLWREITHKSPHFWAAAVSSDTMFNFEGWEGWTTEALEARQTHLVTSISRTGTMALHLVMRGFPAFVTGALVPHVAQLVELDIALRNLEQLSAFHRFLCIELPNLTSLRIGPGSLPNKRALCSEKELAATFYPIDIRSLTTTPRLRTLHRVPMDLLPFLVRPTLQSIYVTPPMFTLRDIGLRKLQDAFSTCPALLNLTISISENSRIQWVHNVNNMATPSETLPLPPRLQNLTVHAQEGVMAHYLNALASNPYASVELRIPHAFMFDDRGSMLPDRDILDFSPPVTTVFIQEHLREEVGTLEATAEFYDDFNKRVLRTVFVYTRKYPGMSPEYHRLFERSSRSTHNITHLTIRTLHPMKVDIFNSLPHLTFLDLRGLSIGDTLSRLSGPVVSASTSKLDTMFVTFDRVPEGLPMRSPDETTVRMWDARSAVRALTAMLAKRAEHGRARRLSRLVWGVRPRTAVEVWTEMGRLCVDHWFLPNIDKEVRGWSYPRDKELEEGAVSKFELNRLRKLVDGSVERRNYG